MDPATLRQRAEAKLQAGDNATPPEKDLRRIVHELQVHQIQLQMQNEELEQTRSDLDDSLQEASELYDFAPTAYFTLSPDGTILKANLAGATLLGVERPLLIEKRLGLFIPQADLPAFNQFLASVFVTAQTHHCEVSLNRADERILRINIVANLVSGEKAGRFIIHDITSQHQAQESIRQWANAFEHLAHGMFMSAPGTDSILVCNRAMGGLLGRAAREVVGMPVSRLHSPEYHDQLAGLFSLADDSGTHRYESRLLRKDGTTLPVQMETTTVHAPDGTIKYRITTAHDISQQLQFKAAIAERDDRLTLALEGASMGIWDLNIPTGTIIHDKRCASMLGYDAVEITPHIDGLRAMAHPQDLPRMQSAFQDHLNGTTPRFDVEYRLCTKNGDWVWIHGRGRVTSWDKEGNPLRLCGTHTEITSRKRAELTLRQWADAFEHSGYGMGISHIQTNRVLACNPALARMLGRTAEEAIGIPVSSIYPTFFHERLKGLIIEADKTGHLHFEAPLLRPDGSTVPVEVEVVSVQHGEPEDHYRVATIMDISERRQLQSDLRDRDARIAQTLEGADLGAWDWSIPTGEVVYNARWASMLGRTLQDLPSSIRAWEELIHPDDRARVQSTLQNHLEGATPGYETEHRLRHRNGGWVWILDRGKVIERDSAGRPLRACGTHMDISERKQTEAVRDARARLLLFATDHNLNELLRASLDEAEILTDSKVGFYHFVQPDQVTITLQAWSTNTSLHMCQAEGEGRHYPIDVAGVWADAIRLREVIIHNDYASLPARKGLPPGHSPIIRELVVPVIRGNAVVAVLGVGNKPENYTSEDVRLVALLADLTWEISRAKGTEAALRNNQMSLARSQEIAHVGSWDLDTLTRTQVWSDETYRILGLEPGQLQPSSETFMAHVHPDDRQLVEASYINSLRNKSDGYEIEHRIVHHKTGEVRHVHLRCLHIRNHSGRVFRSHGMAQDITERKQVEEQLKQERQRLASIIFGSNVGTWEWNVQTGDVTFNERWAEIVGHTLSELQPISINTWVNFAHPDDLNASNDLLERHFKGELEAYECDARMRHKNGNWIWVRDRGRVTSWTADGKPLLMQGTHWDVTEQKWLEEAQVFLAQTSSTPGDRTFFQVLASYLAKSLGMDFICIDRLEGEGQNARTVAVWCDGRFEDNVSYALQDTPCGMVVSDKLCSYPRNVCELFPKDEVLQQLRAEAYIGVLLHDHSGKAIGLIALISRTPLADPGRVETVLKFVSVRAAAEMERLDVEAALQASEASSRIVLDSLTAHIAVLDVTGTVVAVNEAWKQFARENNADESQVHLGTNYLTVCRSASTSREDKIALQAFDGIQSVIQGAQETFSMEYPCNSPAERRWFRLVVRPLSGGRKGVVVAHENITERRQALNDLQQSLEEKTVLLKEVHHRVKNNLQVVSSLLHMEESQGVDQTKVNVLQEAQNRLRSMALIHETLYRSQNFARIDFNTYIESLCVHITRSFGTGTSKARLERRMEPVKFGLDQAVPCGLIINELISNAMKHGFPDERPGRILLELKLEGQQVRLRVADDGVGLPPGLDMQKAPTLGMRLVWMLSRQLHGSVQIEPGPRTSILVTFPLQVE